VNSDALRPFAIITLKAFAAAPRTREDVHLSHSRTMILM
jgi:hypothetical protein